MTSGSKLILAALLGATAIQLPAQTNNASPFKDQKEKASYAFGLNVGSYLKRAGLDIDLNAMQEGITEELSGQPKLNEQQMREAMMVYQQETMHKLAEKNKREGDAFLAENKTKPGVKVLSVKLPDDSTAELQYKVITEGKGPLPGTNDMVTVNYRGTLIDGKEFDNSAKHPPMPRSINGFILGWKEALKQMPVGSKWELYVPSSLAYGDRGTMGIPPGSTLIFEVELLNAEPPKPSTSATRPPQSMTSDIVRVPSAEEMKKGAKVEVIKAEDVEKRAAELQSQNHTNKNK